MAFTRFQPSFVPSFSSSHWNAVDARLVISFYLVPKCLVGRGRQSQLANKTRWKCEQSVKIGQRRPSRRRRRRRRRNGAVAEEKQDPLETDRPTPLTGPMRTRETASVWRGNLSSRRHPLLSAPPEKRSGWEAAATSRSANVVEPISCVSRLGRRHLQVDRAPIRRKSSVFLSRLEIGKTIIERSAALAAQAWPRLIRSRPVPLSFALSFSLIDRNGFHSVVSIQRRTTLGIVEERKRGGGGGGSAA